METTYELYKLSSIRIPLLHNFCQEHNEFRLLSFCILLATLLTEPAVSSVQVLSTPQRDPESQRCRFSFQAPHLKHWVSGTEDISTHSLTVLPLLSKLIFKSWIVKRKITCFAKKMYWLLKREHNDDLFCKQKLQALSILLFKWSDSLVLSRRCRKRLKHTASVLCSEDREFNHPQWRRIHWSQDCFCHCRHYFNSLCVTVLLVYTENRTLWVMFKSPLNLPTLLF